MGVRRSRLHTRFAWPSLAAAQDLVTIWDTDSPEGLDAIPRSAAYFLGYDDGNPIYQEIQQQFPQAKIIPITTVPWANNYAARMCDTEASGFQPDQAAYWAAQKIKLGLGRPCIYVEVSQKDEVVAELVPYGLQFARDIDCYLAWWNGNPVVPEGIVQTPWGPVGCGVGNIGIQYLHNGDLYDVSVAFENWVNGPGPSVQKGDEVLFVRNPGPAAVGPVAEGGICQCDSGGAVNMGESWPNIVSAYAAVNAPLVVIDDPDLLSMYLRKGYTPYSATVLPPDH